jgi:hypothetical protein
MKLKTPIVLTITESEYAALLWHVFNHAGLAVSGEYDLQGMTPERLVNLGKLAHFSSDSSKLWNPVNTAIEMQNIDLETGAIKVKSIEVKLNDKYTAEVTSDKVTVGCQTFTHETILNLAKAVEEIQNKS